VIVSIVGSSLRGSRLMSLVQTWSVTLERKKGSFMTCFTKIVQSSCFWFCSGISSDHVTGWRWNLVPSTRHHNLVMEFCIFANRQVLTFDLKWQLLPHQIFDSSPGDQFQLACTFLCPCVWSSILVSLWMCNNSYLEKPPPLICW
jgi:hypothetical protein